MSPVGISASNSPEEIPSTAKGCWDEEVNKRYKRYKRYLLVKGSFTIFDRKLLFLKKKKKAFTKPDYFYGLKTNFNVCMCVCVFVCVCVFLPNQQQSILQTLAGVQQVNSILTLFI